MNLEDCSISANDPDSSYVKEKKLRNFIDRYKFLTAIAIISILIMSMMLLPPIKTTEAQSSMPSDFADYVVLGKSINHRQLASGQLTLLNTVFFAEIFPLDLNPVSPLVENGVLFGPGDASKGLHFSNDNIPFLAGAREMTIAGLTARFPDTTYTFSFDTPSGSVTNLPATFIKKPGANNNPGPIEITLIQGSLKANSNSIDPDQDVKVIWSDFSKGAADPNGIIDDMIYVILGNCMGDEINHSGHAISDLMALTYDRKEYIIPKEKLFSGQSYQLEVEHSNMETDIYQGIEIIVTYAATSFLDFQTTGENNENIDCPAHPYAMDGGQTDRVIRL